MSNSIIVTGFGPFRNHPINASWEAVKILPDEIDDSIKIIKKEVPVEYTEVQKIVPLLWNEYNPLLVIHVGVSGESRKVTIEKCANRDGYEQCDSIGKIQTTGKACEMGDECIFTGIDVHRICCKLNNSNTIDAVVSTNAGRYLCEFIYYTSLKIDHSRTLFVHVPPLGFPYSAIQLSQGLLEIIHHALEEISEEKKICINIVEGNIPKKIK